MRQLISRLLWPLVTFALLTVGLFGSSVISRAGRQFVVLDVPFLSQTALREQEATRMVTLGNDRRYPLWEYGCGVASLAMVYRYYGVDTDVVRLNDVLRRSGGFSGALLAWPNTDAFLEAGRPHIQGVVAVATGRPTALQRLVDQELAKGHPVIAYLGGKHYVVLTGKDDRGGYFMNDPWKRDDATGKNIPLEQNEFKLKFDQVTQFVFVYPDRNAPTNGIPVTGAISNKYYSLGGSKGKLGNPLAPAEDLGDNKLWQRFDGGAILLSPPEVYALYDVIWKRYQEEGGIAKLGLPRSDMYSYYLGSGGVEWRADFADASILWTEGDRADKARLLTAQNGIRSEYFSNPDLKGPPVYKRYEEDMLFDWQSGAPGPWVEPDGFSARFVTKIQVGGFGWFYNFVIDADDGARLLIDNKVVLDGWTDSQALGSVTQWLSRGDHTIEVQYRELQGEARLLFAYSTWPSKPVFAAESTLGPYTFLPAPVPLDDAMPAPAPITGLSAESVAPLVYDVVLPDETALLTLELRNSGSVLWTEDAVALINQGGNLTNAPARLMLDAPVAPMQTATWVLQVPVSGASGVRTARYQMRYKGQPFGDVVTVYVVVLPEPLKDAEQRIRDQIEEWQRQGEQVAEEMMQRILDELQR